MLVQACAYGTRLLTKEVVEIASNDHNGGLLQRVREREGEDEGMLLEEYVVRSWTVEATEHRFEEVDVQQHDQTVVVLVNPGVEDTMGSIESAHAAEGDRSDSPIVAEEESILGTR